MKKFFILSLFICSALLLRAQAPTGSDNTITILEDNDRTFVAGDFGFNDGADGDAFLQVEISVVETFGTLYIDLDGDNIVDAGEDVAVPGNEFIPVVSITDLKFKPDPDDNGAPYSIFRFYVWDDDEGQSLTDYQMRIDVTAVNDEPSFTAGGDQVVDEDTGPHTIVNWATLMDEGAANEGGQVLSFNVSNDNNPLFSAQPTVNPISGNLDYTLTPNASGSATVTISIQDDGGTANGGDDESPAQTFDITVNPLNDLPTAADNAVNCFENSFIVLTFPQHGYNDIDGDPLDHIEINAVPGNGDIWIDTDGNGMINGAEAALIVSDQVTLAELTGNFLRYRPDPDWNSVIGPAESYRFRVNDGTAYSAAIYTMDITVDQVNSEPYFDAVLDPPAVNEDAGAQTLVGHVTGIDAGAPDEAAQVLTFNVTNSNNPLFSAQPSVDPATGTLTYTPAPNASGTATVFIFLSDDGGTASGGDDTSPTQSFDITVNPLNDLPTAADNTVNGFENGVIQFNTAQFSYADTDGDPLDHIEITLAPGLGSLWVDVNGNNIIDGGEAALPGLSNVSAADIAAGNLKFEPIADENGIPYTTFDFRVNDGTDYSAVAYTMTLNIQAVNSEPSFTAGADENINEDAGAQTVLAWATAIDPGAPDEGGDVLTFVLSNDNNPLFTVQPAVDPITGDLTYTPAPNAFGVANVDIYLEDDGGTADGGDDTSPTQSFVITVNSVNDEPTALDNTVNLFENSIITFVIGHFNYADTEGDPFTQVEITTAPGNGTLWDDINTNGVVDGGEAPLANGNVVTTAVISANRLRYIPVADENGVAYTTFDFRVYDGSDYSVLPAYVMTIDVDAVNSEPYFDAVFDPPAVNEDAGAQTVPGWATGIDPGGADEGAQVLTFVLTNDNNPLFSVQPAVDPVTGDLTYTPAPNAFGVANVDIYLEDDGGTAFGGDDTSPTQSFVITVDPLNDLPILATNLPLNINEGQIGQIISTALLEVTDADNVPSDIEFTLTGIPGDGTLYLSGTPLILNDVFTQADINANAVTYSHGGGEGTPDNFTFTVADGDGGTIPATVFTINVTAVNDAPVFTSTPTTTTPELVMYTYNITTTDSDLPPDPITITYVSGPAWLAFVDNGDGTALLSGMVPGGAPLNNPIQLTVSDGVAPPVAQNFNLVVTIGVTADASFGTADPDTTCTNDSYTLSGNQPPAGYYGEWTVVSGAGTFADNTLYNTEVSGLNSGLAPNNSNTFRWTISNGDGSYQVFDDVVIVNNTVISEVTDIFNVCGSNAVLQADNALFPGETGLWTVEGSPFPVPVIATPNNRTTNVSGLNYNLNQFRWTVTKETCSDFAIMDVWVTEVYATAGGPAEICSEPFTIEGNDPSLLGGTGLWTLGAGSGNFAVATDATTTVTNSHQDVVNEYVWTVTVNGCQDQASVFIENNIPTTAVITTPNPSTSCNGSYNISAVPADATDPNETGYWTTVTPGVVIDFPNNATTTVSNLQAGANLFTWHITNGTCPESTADVTINYYLPTIVDAGTDQTICEDFYSLAGSPLNPGETGLWTNPLGGGNIQDPTSANTLVTNIQRGLNTFQWTVSRDICSNSATVDITNLSVNAVISTPDPQEACFEPWPIQGNNPASQDIVNPPTATTGIWTVQSGGANVDLPLAFNTTVSNMDPGNNNFIWNLDNGTCSDTDTITIINNIPTTADAGRDTIVCSYTLPNLNGNNNYDPARETGFWRVLAGSANITTPSLYNSSVTNLDLNCTPWTPDWYTGVNAVNVFEWVIQKGSCESTDQVRVLNGLPEPADAGTDQTVCENTVNLDAIDEGSCTQSTWWEEIPNAGDFFDPLTGNPIADYTEGPLPDPVNMPFNIHVENIQNGLTQFIWHKKNEYQYSDGTWFKCELTDTVEVTSLGDFEDVQAGTNDAVCENYYFPMKATNPDTLFTTPPYVYYTTGEWSVIFGNGNFDEPTLYNTTVRNMAATDNIYRWTITNHDLGCIMSDDVYINSARPSAAVAGPDDEVCVDFAVLSANVPARYTNAYWTLFSGSAVILNNSCTSFACDALATSLGNTDPNVFLWNVENVYTGPFGGYSVGNPLVCTLQDTLVIINNGFTVDAGNDVYVCSESAPISATTPDGGTGIWSTFGSATFASTGGTSSSLEADIVNNLTRGKNTFTWTVTRGICSDFDQVIVWDNNPNPNPNAGLDQVLCTDSTTLSSNSITRSDTWYDITGTIVEQEGYSTQGWSVFQGTGTFDIPSSTNTWVRNIAQGDNEYIWTAWYHFTDYTYEPTPGVPFTQDCPLRDTVNIYNNSVNATAGLDPPIVCGVQGPGASTFLDADPSQSGVWSAVFNPGPSNIVEPTAFNSEVTGMQNGNHIYRWTVTSTYNMVNCQESDDVTVRVRIPTTSVVNPSTLEVCINESPLSANEPLFGTGTWSSASGSLDIIDDPTNNLTFVTLSQNGVTQWQWTIDYDGCPSNDIITVTNNTVTADANVDIDPNLLNICIEDTLLIANDPNTFNVSPPLAIGTWTANLGTTTFDDNTLYNTTVRNLSSAFPNILTWTVTKGSCIESDQLFINNNSFTIGAGADQIICNENTNLNGEQPTPGTGEWIYLSGSGGDITTPTLFNTQVTNIIAGGSSLFRWTISRNNCSASDEVTITNNQVDASAGVDQTTCTDNIANMPAGQPGPGIYGNWQRIFGGGIPADPTLYNTSVSGLNPNVNTFRWNLSRSICTDFDEVDIINNEPADFIIEADKETCDGNSSISVNIFPPNGSGIWTQTSGSGTITDNTDINTTVTGLEPGLNEYRWRVTNAGCVKQDFMTVTNNEVIADAGIPKFVCEDTTLLAAADPLTNYTRQGNGTWTLLAGNGDFDNNTLYNTVVRNLDNGLNTFTWTLNLGSCSDDDIAEVTNNSVSANASNQTVCNNIATFDGNNEPGADGLWSVVGSSGTPNITEPSLNISTVTNLGQGINTFRWLVSNPAGCSDSIDIQINNGYFTISAGTDQNVCSTTATLAGENPGAGKTGFWYVIAGGATVTNSALNTSSVTGLTPGDNIFRWVVNSASCSASSEVIIRNNNPTNAQILLPVLADREVCSNTVTVEGTNPVFGSGVWSISTAGANILTPSVFQTDITNLDPGNNIITWTITNGKCVSDDVITITNNEVTSVAGGNQTICADATSLNATDPALIYPNQGIGFWTNLSGNGAVIANSFMPNSAVTNLPIGTTLFRWTVEQGSCTAPDDVQITNSSVTASANDQADCVSDFTLDGNDPSGFGGNGYWEIIAGDGTIASPSTQFDTQITGVPNGNTTTLRWFVTNGTCDDDIQVSVTNNNFSVSAGPVQTICTDNTGMNGEDPLTGTGYWELVAGSGIFSNSTDRLATVTGISQGLNVYRWTVSRNGCTNDATVNVTNNSPSTALITGPLVTETCDGTATLTSNLPAPYYADNQYWELQTGNATFNDPTTGFSVDVSDLAPGNNIFRWAITRGACPESEDFITITNNEVFSVPGGNQTICTDATFLNATDPAVIYPNQGTGLWSNLSGNGAVIANSYNPNTAVSNIPNGITTFQWAVSLGSCSDPQNIQVTNSSVTASANDQADCVSDFTLNGNDPSGFGGNGYWEIIAGDGTIASPSTQFDTQITGVPNGNTTTLRWFVTNGTCDDDIQVSVTNNNFSVSAGPVQTICTDNTGMNGEDPLTGTGYWELVAGSGIFSNSTDRLATVTGISQGLNVYRWTVSRNGCTNDATVNVTNNSPSTALITGPLVTETCDGTATLTSNLPAPYYADNQYWELQTGNATFNDPTTGFSVDVSDLAPGNNIFRWAITRGACPESEDFITITNNEVVSVPGGNQTICTDATFLNATDPAVIYPNQGTGLWSNLSGNGAVIANSYNPNTAVSNIPNGITTFQWAVSLGSCSDPQNIQVTNSSVTASANDQADCVSDFTLNGNDPSGFGGNGYWEIIAGDGTIASPSTQFDTQITGVPNGNTTTLRWFVTNGTCDDDIQVSVTNNNFSVSAGPVQTICTDNTGMNGEDPLTGTGYWELVAGSGIFSNSTDRLATVTGIAQGLNVYRWTVSRNGCTNDATVNVTNNSPSTALITGPLVTETCDGTATLTSNLPAPYYADNQYWELISGNVTYNDPTTGFSVDVSDLAPGNNIFRWAITRGACPESEDFITITNNEVVSVPGGNQTICTDATFLNATDPAVIYPNQGTGLWSNLSGNGAVIANSYNPNTAVSNIPNGITTFQWAVSLGSCSDFQNIQVTNSSVTASANDQADCVSDFTLNGNDPSGFGGNGYWEIIAGDGTIASPSTQFDTQITGVPNGNTTTLRWFVTNGTCDDDIQVSVTNNNFSVSAGPVQTICADNTGMNGEDPLTGTGYWELVAGSGIFSNSTDRLATVTGIAQGLNVYRWTVTRDGCTNDATVNITNNSPSTALITGPLVTETCDGTATLTSNLPAPYYADNQYWELVGGNVTFNDPTTSFTMDVSDLAPGNNIFRWAVSRGTCPESEDFITIVNNEVRAEAGPTETICAGNTSLNAIATTAQFPFQGAGSWTNLSANGAVITNSLSETTTVTNLPVGSTIFQWTVELGSCSRSDNVTINNYSVNATATNAETCTSTITALTGNTPAPTESGLWSSFTPGVTYDNQSLYNTAAFNLVPGFNTFVWTLNNAYCSDFHVIQVEYIDPVVNPGADQDLCDDFTFLSAQNPAPGSGTWQLWTGSGIIENSTNPNTFVSNLGIGTNVFRWYVVDRTCDDEGFVTINNNQPYAEAGSNVTTCFTDVNLAADEEGAGETASWKVLGGTGIITDNTLYNSTVTNLSPGVNVFQWTVDNGTCSSSDEVQIFNNQITSINAGIDQQICDDFTNLSALAPGAGETGYWDNVAGNGVYDNSLSYNTTVRELNQGDNVLVWTLTRGTCFATDTLVITNNSPTSPNLGPDAEICLDFYTLVGTSPGIGETGIWSKEFGAQGTIGDPTSEVSIVTNIGLGSNTFRWTISNAICDAYDDKIITNNTIATDAGLDASLCIDTAVLSADNPAPGTGYWDLVNPSSGPIFDNSTSYTTVVRNLSSGPNIFVWTAHQRYMFCLGSGNHIK
jgi:hypothetical protein